MSKHTPGPWAIDWNVARVDVFSADAGTLVASIRRSAMSGVADEAARANARLIAAAPELLEALQAYDAWSAKVLPHDEDLRALREKIRAAIAKATGSQS